MPLLCKGNRGAIYRTRRDSKSAANSIFAALLALLFSKEITPPGSTGGYVYTAMQNSYVIG